VLGTQIREELSWAKYTKWRADFDLVKILYLISAFIAPLELRLVASLTQYDLLIFVLAFLILIGPRRLHVLPTRFFPIIYFFLLFALLSTFRSTHPEESLTQILQFAFIFFVQLPVILTLSESRRIVYLSLLLFLLGGLYGMAWSMIAQEVQGAGRTLTFYSDNPNRLGYPTAYLLPFVLCLLFFVRRHTNLLLALALAAPLLYLMMWALAASGSRSSTVGVLVSLLVFLTFYKGINLKTPLRLLVSIMLITTVGYVLYQGKFFPDTLHQRIERTLMLEETLVDDRSRLAIAGLLAFQESPFLGVGLDNFKYVTRDYVAAATPQPPHNLWIQFLSSIGIIGTTMFFLLIAFWYLTVFQALRRIHSQEQRELLWALIASMTSVLFIYMFIPIMIHRHYWLIYGIGLAVALRCIKSPMESASLPDVPKFRSSGHPV
jgi:O-antigen ligase